MVEEAAPVIICEIKNPFDSDGAVLHTIENDFNEITQTITPELSKTDHMNSDNVIVVEENPIQGIEKTIALEEPENSTDSISEKCSPIKTTEHLRRPTDYIRREGVMRIKKLENKKKTDMQIFKVQLRAALLEEEKNKSLSEKAKLEVEKAKFEVEKAKSEAEKAKLEAEKAKLELEKVKKSM